MTVAEWPWPHLLAVSCTASLNACTRKEVHAVQPVLSNDARTEHHQDQVLHAYISDNGFRITLKCENRIISNKNLGQKREKDIQCYKGTVFISTHICHSCGAVIFTFRISIKESTRPFASPIAVITEFRVLLIKSGSR